MKIRSLESTACDGTIVAASEAKTGLLNELFRYVHAAISTTEFVELPAKYTQRRVLTGSTVMRFKSTYRGRAVTDAIAQFRK